MLKYTLGLIQLTIFSSLIIEKYFCYKSITNKTAQKTEKERKWYQHFQNMSIVAKEIIKFLVQRMSACVKIPRRAVGPYFISVFTLLT